MESGARRGALGYFTLHLFYTSSRVEPRGSSDC